MTYDPGEIRYRWLRVTLGAVVAVVVAVSLIVVIYRYTTTWSPPGVVMIPDAPPVDVDLQPHPRLVAPPEAITALGNSRSSPEYETIMRKADQFYDEYLVDPLQGDTIYPGYFALAWRISGEDRYLDAARDMVLKHCRFPRWKRRPESANFYKIEMAYAVGLAYDLLYDQFSESEKEGIEEDLSEVLDGLLWHLQGNPNPPFWHDAPHSNYYVAQHSAAGILAICLGNAYPRWDDALAYAYDGLQPSIDLLEDDGGWIEGLTYLDFCWGQHALLFLNSLRVNDGPDRLREDWYKTSVLFALAGIHPSGLEQVNFGDNIRDPIASMGYLWRARSFFDSEFLDQFLESHIAVPDYPRIPLDALLIQAILEFDPELPLDDFEEPEACLYFPGIEWVSLREDWFRTTGTFFAVKAGYGGWDHNHVDQGTYILAFNGVPVITDAGRGVFESRKIVEDNLIHGGPWGHSVFIPSDAVTNGTWDDFTMYSDNARHRQADATIENFTDTGGYTSFSMDLDGAYPAEDMEYWRRNILWLKPGAEIPGGAFVILDSTDSPGEILVQVSMENTQRREGQVFSLDLNPPRELGLFWFSPDADVDFEMNRSVNGVSPLDYAKIIVNSTSGEDSETYDVFTVLLPFDDIARVVCDGYVEDDIIGVFVDGYLLEYERDSDGAWQFAGF